MTRSLLHAVRPLLAGLALLAAAAPVGGQPTAPGPAVAAGRWLNPKATVVVDTAPCGDRLCGTVACATPEAVAKAREKGTPQLIGTDLLERLEYRGNGRWRGKVFVPDMQGRFEAAMTQLSPDRIEVKGCILAGLICKKQVWTRIPPNSCAIHLRRPE